MKALQKMLLVLLMVCALPIAPLAHAEGLTLDLNAAALSGGGAFAAGRGIILPKNSAATLSVNVSSSSLYRVSISGELAADSIYNISLDANMTENVVVGKHGYASVSFYMELQPSQRTITLFVAAGRASINRIELLAVSSSAATSFVQQLNAAATPQAARDAVMTYAQPLHMDIAAVENRIFYPISAYDKLLHRQFETVNAVMEALYAALYEEIENPRVALFANGTQQYALRQSEMEIEIARNRSGNTTIAAVYDADGRLFYVNTFAENGAAPFCDTISLSGQADAARFAFKLLSWNLSGAMQPKEKFNGLEREIYVSPVGRDTADGSAAAPFATLSRAKAEIKKYNAAMQGDIVVHLAAGTYNLAEAERISQDYSGKNGFRVIFKGASVGETVLSGGQAITGWQPWKDGIYKASFQSTSELRELYVNGLPAKRAASNLLYTYEADSTGSGTAKKIIVSDKEFPTLAHPNEAELVWKMTWVCQRTPVSNIEKSGGKTVVTLANFYQPDRIDSVMVQPGKRFYIENALELLDEPGEFYYSVSEKALYYYPEAGQSMHALEVVAPMTEGLLSVTGTSLSNKVSHISFENITFRYGTWRQPNEYPVLFLQAGSAVNAETKEQQILPPGQICLSYADNISVTGCRFGALGTNALELDNGVTNTVLCGNVMQNIGGAAISVGNTKQADSQSQNDGVVCKNIQIANNVIRRTAIEYRGLPSIVAYYGNGIKLINNDIKDTAYSGISVGWGWDNALAVSKNSGRFLIQGNRIARVLRSLIDGANVYTLGALPDSVIRDNYIDRNMGPVQQQYPGIYLDEGSRYINVHRNVITNCGSRWLLINSSCNNLNAEISGNYTDGTTHTNKSGTAVGENSIGMTEPTPAAQAVIGASGVKAAYQQLLANVEIDDAKTTALYASPDRTYHEGTLVQAAEFTGGVVTECSENYVSVNTGNWMEYTVELPQDGIYSVAAYVAIGGSDSSKQTEFAWKVTSENVLRYPKAAYTGSYGTYKQVMLGEAAFRAGTNTLWIKNISNVACHISHFIIYDDIYRAAVDFTDGQVKECGENYVSFNSGNWVEYSMNFPQSGTYRITLYAALGGDDPSKQIEVAWQMRPNGAVRFSNIGYTGGYGTYRPFVLGDITLPAGSNTLWIRNIATSGYHIRKILIQKQ